MIAKAVQNTAMREQHNPSFAVPPPSPPPPSLPSTSPGRGTVPRANWFRERLLEGKEAKEIRDIWDGMTENERKKITGKNIGHDDNKKLGKNTDPIHSANQLLKKKKKKNESLN